VSVLEKVVPRAVEQASGRAVPFTPRRAGDVAWSLRHDASLASACWAVAASLDRCADAWRWQSAN
jgi:UDP-glucose 4-epimerase